MSMNHPAKMPQDAVRQDYGGPRAVWDAGADARATFLTKTYLHLAGAIIFFTVIEAIFWQMGWSTKMLSMFAGNGFLILLGGFVVVNWLASSVAAKAKSMPAQYAALGGMVLAESIIFAPLLALAIWKADELGQPNVIVPAAVTTLVATAILTAIVFITKKDFSFLRGILIFASICAVGLIIASALMGFNLGLVFIVFMIIVAGGAILYDTSNVLHHYPEDRYVSASLELFTSVALLFWYVLRLFMSRD